MNMNDEKAEIDMNTTEMEIIYIVRIINDDHSYGSIVGIYRSRSDAYEYRDRMQILHEYVNYQVQPYGLY